MSRPSEPIVSWFRDTLQKRGMNAAALAKAVGARRRDVRNTLAGKEPLTVDQLLTWSQALELSLEDLAGLPEELPTPTPVEHDPADPITVDPYGLQGEQALKLAFGLGVDFSFVADSKQLAGLGIPAQVLEARPEHMLIQLDAAFHVHNKPVYSPEGVTLVLSFSGAAVDCFFPWSAVLQVSYRLEPPEPEGAPEVEEEPPPPGLRLVKG